MTNSKHMIRDLKAFIIILKRTVFLTFLFSLLFTAIKAQNNPICVTGIIGNYVWNDVNRDGIQDPTEQGISGAIVSITYPNGNVISTLTDINGFYSFSNLAASNLPYSITFATPSGSTPTLPNNTNDAEDSDPINGIVQNIIVTMGSVNDSIDAGFYYPINLTGNVWHDIDAMTDNFVDSSGSSLAIAIPNGLNVSLVNNITGKVYRTSLVSGIGRFSFINILPGNYYIVLSTFSGIIGQDPPVAKLPTGWQNTGEKLGLSSGRDLQINGILNTPVGFLSVFNANFGIRADFGSIGVD